MKELPLRMSDHEEKKREVWSVCAASSLRFFPSSFVCIALLNNYFSTSIKDFARLCIAEQKPILEMPVKRALEQHCVEFTFWHTFAGT